MVGAVHVIFQTRLHFKCMLNIKSFMVLSYLIISLKMHVILPHVMVFWLRPSPYLRTEYWQATHCNLLARRLLTLCRSTPPCTVVLYVWILNCSGRSRSSWRDVGQCLDKWRAFRAECFQLLWIWLDEQSFEDLCSLWNIVQRNTTCCGCEFKLSMQAVSL